MRANLDAVDACVHQKTMQHRTVMNNLLRMTMLENRTAQMRLSEDTTARMRRRLRAGMHEGVTALQLVTSCF